MEKLLNVNEVAKLLDESPEAVYRLARLDIIPSIRIGRKVKFSSEQLQEFVKNGGCKNNN